MSAPASQDVQSFRWIASLQFDTALLIGTPVVIIPLILGIAFFFADDDVFLVISTFGAGGHHAPGLMRAYGDRKLFRRFWLRFTIVPIATLTIFLMFSLQQLPGVTLILVVWGLWHFLMQTYGFGRIYDAKVGAADVRNHYIDLALCIGWAGLCVLYAPGRLSYFLSLALQSGLTFTLSVPLSSLRLFWLGATMAVTMVFVADLLRRLAVGKPVNLAKFTLFAVTFSFFWLCGVGIRNLLLGIAMFELFHDVQYLAIVWLFNRNRAEKDASAGAFIRFLFRPGFVGLYVGMVIAYGFVAFAAKTLTSDLFQHVLLSLIATSNVMHFYYDGFIWKVREPETRVALGVQTPGDSFPTVRQRLAGFRQRLAGIRQRFAHPAKWMLLLLVVAALMTAEQVSEMTKLEQAQAVVDRIPDSVTARTTLAHELVHAEKYDDAILMCKAAMRLGEPDYRTHMYLGIALSAIDPASGFRELERAYEMYPHDALLRFHLAMGYIRKNQPDTALRHLQASVDMKPDDPVALYNLGILHSAMGDDQAAVQCLEDVVRRHPEFSSAYRALGESLLKQGKRASGLEAFREGLKVAPDDQALRQRLVEALDEFGGERSSLPDSDRDK